MFPDQAYARRCQVCSYVLPPRAEWDETPAFDFCPRDGLPLQRIACFACDAPITVRERPTSFIAQLYGGGGDLVLAGYCGHCGAKIPPLVPTEPQRRVKPAPNVSAMTITKNPADLTEEELRKITKALDIAMLYGLRKPDIEIKADGEVSLTRKAPAPTPCECAHCQRRRAEEKKKKKDPPTDGGEHEPS